MQAPLAFKARCFGGSLSGEGLKSWGTRYGSNPSLLKEKPWGLSFLLIVVGALGLGLMVKLIISLSYLLQCGFFLIHPICRSCSASFWVLSRGNCSIGSCRFGVSVGGHELENLLNRVLEWICSPSIIFISISFSDYLLCLHSSMTDDRTFFFFILYPAPSTSFTPSLILSSYWFQVNRLIAQFWTSKFLLGYPHYPKTHNIESRLLHSPSLGIWRSFTIWPPT